MTRERFEHIQREFQKAFTYQPFTTSALTEVIHTPLLLLGETIAGIESAWTERDDAIAVKNNLCQQNTELLEDVSALTIERDSALMEGMALVQEKDGLQVEIERLMAENAVKDHKIIALTAKVEELEERIYEMKIDY